MRKKAMILLLLLTSAVMFAQGDPNAWVRELGEKKVATRGDGARMVALLIGGGESGVGGAVALLRKKGIIRGVYKPDAPLTSGALSLLVMKAKGFSGGLFYSIFKSPRYAYREMIYKKFLPAGSSEYSKVSGGLLLSVIAAVRGDVKLEMKGGAK